MRTFWNIKGIEKSGNKNLYRSIKSDSTQKNRMKKNLKNKEKKMLPSSIYAVGQMKPSVGACNGESEIVGLWPYLDFRTVFENVIYSILS